MEEADEVEQRLVLLVGVTAFARFFGLVFGLVVALPTLEGNFAFDPLLFVVFILQNMQNCVFCNCSSMTTSCILQCYIARHATLSCSYKI